MKSFGVRALLDPRDHSPEVSEGLIRDLGYGDETARRFLSLVVGKGIFEPNVWMSRHQIPRRLCEAASGLPRLKLETSITSPIDGFQKLGFRSADGQPIETVLIPLLKDGAVSLCVSSQVGCAMECVYCATTRMPSRRNLAGWEIIDQVIQARALAWEQGRRVTGVVFMGMGEPFLNYDRVLGAAELLRCSYGGAIRGKAITISTVGILAGIDRFTHEERKFRLSISLGAATDVKRAQLVPVAARTPVKDLIEAARRHSESRRDRVMLAYVCVGGFNCGEEDAIALGELLRDIPVRLDLIDVTDPTGRFTPPSPEELKAFRDHLTQHVGQPVVRRYSGGKDIAAACGTLAGNMAPRAYPSASSLVVIS